VRNLTEFGAFVEITEEIDGLIHVSDMSWTKRVKHPSEVLKKGDRVQARITAIDVENQRVSLSIKEFLPNEWQDFVDNHMAGDTVEGRVVNITDFGLFVDIYEGLEGLVHVSEVDTPGGRLEDHFVVGQWVRARILRIDDQEHKVGLTMRGVTPLNREESRLLEQAYQDKHGKPAEGEAETRAAAATAEGEAPAREGGKKGRKAQAESDDGGDDADREDTES
jgi:small subunit ribosomal protein S1